MFVDKISLTVRAGKGGDGLTSWRREKFIARGGPDGGDGGKGGDVVLYTDHNINTLSMLRHKALMRAEDGQRGKRKRQHGKDGQDITIKVPVGTTVWHKDQLIADLAEDNQKEIIARGGKGGFGNAHFVSSVRRAPEVSELGEPGETKELRLELKLLADVGLVGLPNAGKSTLLSVISNAKPEIAAYPFTTTSPNLGMAEVDAQSFLVADIPGLIEGASQGKGLGDEFLRHIERTSVLLHLVDVTSQEPVQDWQTVNQELASYAIDLTQRPQLVVLTKIDVVDEKAIKQAQDKLNEAGAPAVMAISAVAHKNLTPLLRKTYQLVKQQRQAIKPAADEPQEVPTLTLADDPDAWWVEKDRGKFVVKGQKIEGFATRTDYEQPAGVDRLRDILNRWGISRELLRLGIKNGDVVKISGKEFKW